MTTKFIVRITLTVTALLMTVALAATTIAVHAPTSARACVSISYGEDAKTAEIRVASAEGVADILAEKLTPEMIDVYEQYVAGEKFLSSASAAKLNRIAKALNVSVQKLKVLMLMQDLAARTGEKISLDELAALKDADLIRKGKHLADEYGKTLSEEERKELKEKFKAAM